MIAWTLRPRDRRVARHLVGGKPVLIAGTMRQVSRFHGMSEQAEACRRKAAECERAVALATRPAMQAIYRDLAVSGTKWPNTQRTLNSGNQIQGCPMRSLGAPPKVAPYNSRT